jgi:hypothetical protein
VGRERREEEERGREMAARTRVVNDDKRHVVDVNRLVTLSQ